MNNFKSLYEKYPEIKRQLITNANIRKQSHTKRIPRNMFKVHLFFENYETLKNTYYTVNQLHAIIKKFSICPIQGRKPDLAMNIYFYFLFSSLIVKIQKCVRGMLLRQYLRLFGPALKKRHLCTNDTDFITFNDLKNIPFPFFYSYQDCNHFIYGFDINSLISYLQKHANRNPYNREKFPAIVKKQLTRISRHTKRKGKSFYNL